MSERFKGNFEIIDQVTGMSPGTIGTSINPAASAVILENLHGITNLVEVDPEPTGSVTPIGQWTGTSAEARPVVVKLWREPETNETFAGQVGAALAAEMNEQQT